MSMENATCANSAENATSLDEHLRHVQRFLLDMYQTMIDPVEEFDGNIEQLCELLLKRAREDREALRHRAAERRVVDAAVAERKAGDQYIHSGLSKDWHTYVEASKERIEAEAALLEERKEQEHA